MTVSDKFVINIFITLGSRAKKRNQKFQPVNTSFVHYIFASLFCKFKQGKMFFISLRKLFPCLR